LVEHSGQHGTGTKPQCGFLTLADTLGVSGLLQPVQPRSHCTTMCLSVVAELWCHVLGNCSKRFRFRRMQGGKNFTVVVMQFHCGPQCSTGLSWVRYILIVPPTPSVG